MPDWQASLARTLCQDIPDDIQVTRLVRGHLWTAAELSDGSAGIAMHVETATRPRLHESLVGLSARQAAWAIASWNLEEASDAMAVINAWHNNKMRLAGAARPYDYMDSCTTGMETSGKTIALVGHLSLAPETLAGAKQVYVLERKPQPGDYPDMASEALLPLCDLVIITGSAFVNKTLPRLLQLSAQARVIVIGPSAPLCPGLIGAGIDRICGMAVSDTARVFDSVTKEKISGYRYGQAWMLP